MLYLVKPIFLATDVLIWLFTLMLVITVYKIKRQPNLCKKWSVLLQSKLYNTCLVTLVFFCAVALTDSIHFKTPLSETHNAKTVYGNEVRSLFDLLVTPLGRIKEQSYSKPFATHSLNKSYEKDSTGNYISFYSHLKINEKHEPSIAELGYKFAISWLKWAFISLAAAALFILFKKRHQAWQRRIPSSLTALKESGGFHSIITTIILFTIFAALIYTSNYYHVFGTSKIGEDVLYQTMKSIRTGIIIGTITTIFSLPIAIILGICSGYFGRTIDDIIQYIYTTISAIPGILLISAAVLSLQVWLGRHANWFSSMEESADMRLLMICFILGITGWTSLCRLLRGETLKIREMDYITAAKTLGVSNSSILYKHILPNVMHIVLIITVIDFSSLVLAEAVLSYIGVGVDPSTMSWGNMINSARLEMAREPAIWWSLAAAFIFMFSLVLAANIFADGVRAAFDPREKSNVETS
ncbi:MAG: ABC transporter permease [Legionellales bacterium]|jgi:peptide/nickel transport system permease protein|nr:ABC transporter permease [Legionellales bacterium]